MRNYIEINGVSSLTLVGFAINTLPPISKPPIRNLKEEIDGRDGDIITKLGYGAYDKEIEVGLYGESYDINDIIAFFNTEGEVVFSNEPDKIYNFTILDQIDFEKLVKFKTAVITLHCQPFKYPLTDTPIEVEYEYVTGEGENITLNDTDISGLELDLKGNTSQTGTPTPSSPIPVNVVSGDNEINVVGKNLLNPNANIINIYYNSSTKQFQYNANNRSIVVPIKPNTTYTISRTEGYGNDFSIGTSVNYPTSGEYATNVSVKWSTSILTNTITSGANDKYLLFYFGYQTSESTSRGWLSKTQLEVGDQASTFEPYQGNTYNIDLPVENLCDVILDSSISGDVSYKTYTFEPNTQYTISTNTWVTSSSTANIFASAGTSFSPSSATNGVNGSRTITSDSNGKITIGYRNVNLSLDYSSGNYYIQIEKGTKANSYTPYGTTPIELCKIGNYQDYFYKDSDKWYLHKEIGKVVFTGAESEDWVVRTSTSANYWKVRNATAFPTDVKERLILLSNYFVPNGGANNADYSGNAICGNVGEYAKWLHLSIDNTIANSVATFKTWLSTHNLSIYYIEATPTNTEITYQPLIDQLNLLEQAMSKDSQTNISQVNNDLPFIISASALKKGSDTASIVNDGNIYSKPLIDIEGTGLVTIYLDNTQMFQVNLSELNNITIDTELLEAYSDTQLANRKVVGDYSKFKLQVGTSQLKFGGALTKATITRYKRWL